MMAHTPAVFKPEFTLGAASKNFLSKVRKNFFLSTSTPTPLG
jgi:hypothetical protein